MQCLYKENLLDMLGFVKQDDALLESLKRK